MKIYSEICNVKNKISKEGSNGKPYYALSLTYNVHSEKKNQDFEINDFVFVPQGIYDSVEINQNIRLVGYLTRDKETKKLDVSYCGLYEKEK